MRNKKTLFLASTSVVVISLPFVSTISCNSFFEKHSLFDEGNFEFYYTNTGDPIQSAYRFNEEVVSKNEVLFGASLSAQEIYDAQTTHPDIIGISPDKALTSNGLFMSGSFSEDDKEDFADYIQSLWWAASWRKGGGMFTNVPEDIIGSNDPMIDSPMVDDMLNNYFPGGFEKRQNPLNLFDAPKLKNTYGQIFDNFKLTYPKIYRPGDKIDTTFGLIDTSVPSKNNKENLFDVTKFLPYHPANLNMGSGYIDFNGDELVGLDDELFYSDDEDPTNNLDSDIYKFLNAYAPYVYSHYNSVKVEKEFSTNPIRFVILDEAINTSGVTLQPGQTVEDKVFEMTTDFSNIFKNDGFNLEPVNGGTGVIVVKSKNELLRLLNDPNKHTIAIFPITEWASEENSSSSLIASFRNPVSMTSLDMEGDGQSKHLVGNKLKIDESYALDLISTYFNHWIDYKPAVGDAELARRNYNLDELRKRNSANEKSVIESMGSLNWSISDREMFYEPLKNLVEEYDNLFPSYPSTPNFAPGQSMFRGGARFDYNEHRFIDDVKSEFFSQGTNAIIYYSTNSDDLTEEMETNSQVIENRIANSHGDGKINLRNELLLPVSIAMHRSATFNDADITESVKAWISEHFTVE